DDLSLVSMCAGDGRDTLPVLAATAPGTRAVLVEIDEELAGAARRTAASLGLERVEVRTADAGTTDSYADAVPADVLLVCGVFGNVRDAEAARTVATLPMLLAGGATVVWTRGRRVDHDPTEFPGDPSEHIRELFAAAGFEELSFVRPEDAGFRVGVHRLVVPPQPWQPGGRMFDFV
ncbi:MAG: class I SAM-dependent methyltransferase, partial [Nocardioides sp.]